MAFRGNKAALAVRVQPGPDAPAAVVAATDALLCYDMQPGGNSFTLPNPEYTGAVERPGDAVVGRDRSITFNVILRGPGGTAPPALDTFILGRILRAARFGEITQATPLIASAPLGGASTATSVILPVGASAADDFYNGLPVLLSDQGVGAKQLSMIRDYTGATRTATMMETFSPVPAANVSIPAFLGYRYQANAPEIYLSMDYWLDQKRYYMVNGTVSSLQININVSNNSDTSFTYASVTVTGDVHPVTPEIDENSPVITAGGAMPVFNDADWWIANKTVCGSSFVYDQSIEVARAPCPVNLSGGEAPQIVSITRTVTPTLNETLLSANDYNALATLQTEHGAWCRYGNTTGKTVMFGVTDARFGYSEANIAGNFVQRTPQMFIDRIDRSVSLIFPYF